mgnify:FL=1
MEQQQIKNNNIQTSQNVSNPDEIDLAELMGKLLRKKKFIITTTIIFMVLGLLIALLSPKQFTAGCTVVPQTTGGRSGNMSGLAAMAGINLGSSGTSDGVLSPNTYPDIVKSVPFTREIMQTRITTPRADGDTITLFDFYTDKQYQKFNIISAVKRYTIGLPGLILSQIIKPAEQPDAGDSSATPTVYTLDKREQFAYKAIQNSMSVNLDPKNGIVKLSYVFPEPKGAALAAEQLRVTLGEYVKQFKIEKVEENLAFIEHNYHEAQADFQEKQRTLAAFQDANRGLTTAMARTTEQRLRSEYEIAFTVYSELARQREQAKIAVKETAPLLTVITPVVTPDKKSAPRSALILIGFTMLGIVVSVGWVLAVPAIKEIFAKAKDLN